MQERFDAFARLALAEYRAGRRVGTKALVERLRWAYDLQTTGAAYRMDNSLTSLYARLLIDRHPELADVIETRTRRTQ